jgi:hypothetical protein
MGSTTPATTTTQSNSQPWSEATPLLRNLMSRYAGMNTDVTGGQANALTNLQTAAGSIPNMGAPAAGAVSRLFNSSTAPQAGMLSDAYSQLQGNLAAAADPNNIDPMKTPGLSDSLAGLTRDITNNVKGVYAASGRDPSGAGTFARSLGGGLAQGLAPVLTSQFNTNRSNQQAAAQALFGAGGTTASGLTNLNQTDLQNGLAGINGAGMLTGLYTAPATAQVAAANAAQQQPFSNLAALLQPALGFGALGTQQSGTTTQQPANNMFSNVLGGLSLGAGLLFSDKRLKSNIHKVGMLDNGVPLKSYTMKDDPTQTPMVGVIAQDVAKKVPSAVHKIGKYKAVDYPKVMRMGMLAA